MKRLFTRCSHARACMRPAIKPRDLQGNVIMSLQGMVMERPHAVMRGVKAARLAIRFKNDGAKESTVNFDDT